MTAVFLPLILVLFVSLDPIAAGPINSETLLEAHSDGSVAYEGAASDSNRTPRGIEVDCNNKELMQFLMQSQATFRCVSKGPEPKAPIAKTSNRQSSESRCGPNQTYVSEVGICVPSGRRKRSSSTSSDTKEASDVANI